MSLNVQLHPASFDYKPGKFISNITTIILIRMLILATTILAKLVQPHILVFEPAEAKQT